MFCRRAPCEISGCSLQLPLDAQTETRLKLKLELHCDIVVIWPVIPEAFYSRLNRAYNPHSQRRNPNLTTAQHGALDTLLTGAGEMEAELATAGRTPR